ncbi:MAG TPA: MGMT family protein [bacterium]|nr:MGMT family protein [bacterium]
MARMTAKEKLHKPAERQIKKIDERKGTWLGNYDTMLIPTPLDVDEVIRSVPKGKLTTVNRIREILAAKHGAATSCPTCVGIFCNIAAAAAEEDLLAGAKRVTPYWRVLKSDGTLNPKFPDGTEAQAVRLTAEGHTIVPSKGKKPPTVANWEAKVV